jgi:endonuclease/exonuclease/phosphatase (EEP) superfamily protein YafD
MLQVYAWRGPLANEPVILTDVIIAGMRAWTDRFVSAAVRATQVAATLYVIPLAVLAAVLHAAPPRSGPLALAAVLEPYLFAPLLVATPFALLRGVRILSASPQGAAGGARTLRVALAGGALLYAALFLPGLVSWPPRPTPGAVQVTIATWNVYALNDAFDDLHRALEHEPAEVVMLQEIGHDQANAITSDDHILARYPYSIVRPHDLGALGMTLLSRYPIAESGTLDDPPTIWALIELDGGARLYVINTHPLPARLCPPHDGYRWAPVQIFDPARRDAEVGTVRALIDPWLVHGDAFVLAGDFNLTEREAAYGDLSAGLHDAYREVGQGSGNTWIPPIGVNVPMLRLDYLFSSPAVRPLAVGGACPRGSDHCLLRGTFER